VVQQFERILIRSTGPSRCSTRCSTRFSGAIHSRVQGGDQPDPVRSVSPLPGRQAPALYHKNPRGFDTEAGENDPLAHSLYKELRKKKLLLWAALLHDIGKGRTQKRPLRTRRDLAEKILLEKGANPADAKTVAFLVEHHLLLVQTATRRDINDEETAIAMARVIKKVDLLKMLYLLTVADSMATGPKAWNDWTSSLLRNLFFKVLNVLESGELATGRAVRTVEKKSNRRSSTPWPGKWIRINWTCCSTSCRPATCSTRRRQKFPSTLSFTQTRRPAFVWQIEKSPGADTRTVTICGKDRPGLISKIAGVFTLNNIDILDVQILPGATTLPWTYLK
jgi:[protein-PII] uridylyltransferase